MDYIPRKMNNEQSKLVAAVVVAEREYDIAEAKLLAAAARLEKNFHKV